MSKIRKILLICLTVVCVAFSCFAIAACSSKNWREPSGGVTDNGSRDPGNPTGDLPFYFPEGIRPDDTTDENAYVIHTVSMGGMPINNVRVTVSKNGVKVIEGMSQNGGVKFGGIDFTDYDLSYSELPLGYREDAEGTAYHISANNLEVTSRFNSSVISSNMPSGWTYSMGDVMYNFNYTDANGWTVNLSELLQTKKAVVLNFWATWCGPCASEFPSLNSVYSKYKNDIEVIALSIEKNDTNQVIDTYKNSFSPALEFFMAYDNLGLASSLGGTASVPTTVIIDRYGVIAFRHVGSITSALEWEARFLEFTADDYIQDPSNVTGGETVVNEPVGPYDFLEFDPISDNAFNQAFLDASMEQEPAYSVPAPDTHDGKYNWPFQVAENGLDGMYLAPTNVGTYTDPATNTHHGTDNSWAILYVNLNLQADETLTVDVRLNTESGNDILYIIMNNSSVGAYQGSGQTQGWETVELYRATRPTALTLSIMYYKNTIGSPSDEFVGLKNLKIVKFDPNTTDPIDLRTELSTENADGSYNYLPVYLADDGFYHVQQGATQNPATDSMLFVDIMFETLWTDRHISGYSLKNGDGYGLIPSLYNISFWLFGNAGIDFGYGSAESHTIIDCFHVQDGELDALTPVNATIRTALEAFAQYAFDHSQLFGTNVYKNGHNENTWLELCTYYRTLGGDHTVDGHVCKAHNNPGAGKILQYAIEMVEGINHVDTTIAASLNFMNGVFYKLEPFKGTGAYRIRSLRPYVEGDRVDPYLIVWRAGTDAFYDRPLLEQDDAQGIERFTQYSYNFDAIIYLKEGEYVYPQITTRAVESPGQFDVEVEYLGEEYWQFRTASLADGQWIGENEDTAVYAAIETSLSGPNNDVHYHVLSNGEFGSVVYIDFIHPNYFDQNNNSLKDMVDRGLFNFSEINYTDTMNSYYNKAMAKDPSDPTYGMVEAEDLLVQILSVFLQANSGEGMKTGLWKAFAFYYQYYGPTLWAEMPID